LILSNSRSETILHLKARDLAIPFLSHMKTSLLFGTAFGILGLAAQVIAQTQISTTTGTSGHVQTSKLIGTKVKTAQGEEVGVIKDVVLDRSNGCMAYTVLSTGGAGMRGVGQAKTVAIPWAVYSPTSDLSVLTVSVDRDRIFNAPVFDFARIDEYASTGYINNVYSYYGVSGQVGVSGQTSVTGGATATTAATASPMATASPTATASATASTTATASPRGTRGTSREESTSGQPKSSATPASRGRHAEKMTTPNGEEVTSESTASPSKERSKGSRHRATGETTEPSATPEQE
jgi:sporulation protein YlmC with PRC-barrel domain